MISVIVPVYKVEQYLRECVDSILTQTFHDFELILVDDGSPDRCPNICDEYAARDSRVKVIHQPNGGLSAARNAGIEVARGEYLTFIDSDDYVSPAYLQKLYDAFHDAHTDISICMPLQFEDGSSVHLSEDGQFPVQKMTGRDACLKLYHGDETVPVMAWGKLFHKSCFSEIRFPVGKIHEDEFVVPIILYQAKTVVALAERLYYYRTRLGSIMHEQFSVKRFDAVTAMAECENFFLQQNDAELAAIADSRKQLFLRQDIFFAYKQNIYAIIPPQFRQSHIKTFRLLRCHCYPLACQYLKARASHLYIAYVIYEKFLKTFPCLKKWRESL